MEVHDEQSMDIAEVNMVLEDERRSSKTLIKDYIEKGTLLDDSAKARTLKEKISNYVIEDRTFYIKSYLGVLLYCIRPLQANYVIKDIHMGSCVMHDRPRRVVHKEMNARYYGQDDMIPVMLAWPFMKWGMDIIGPLLEAPRKLNYLIVVIDYFTKWIEAKPMATITGKQVKNFPFDNIVCSKWGGRAGKSEHNACNQDQITPRRSGMGRRAVERAIGSLNNSKDK
nr:hypothetical protein [Tanacetum cinerariifolium]